MHKLYTTVALIISLFSILPIMPLKHWSVRVFDFVRIQVCALQIIWLVIGLFLFFLYQSYDIILLSVLLVSIIIQLWVITPYIPLRKTEILPTNTQAIKLITVNVLQTNTSYARLIELIKKLQPEIVLTTETNQKWEDALGELSEEFPFRINNPEENTYGMHLFSKLEIISHHTHYFIEKNRPSIEANIKDESGTAFTLFGVHPPPASPTEKSSSKQKDAELMILAERIKQLNSSCIVAGDFNNVCWSYSGRQFAKTSSLIDARLGRGIYGTFPVSPKFMRFPIDLVYHSHTIQIIQMKTVDEIGVRSPTSFRFICSEIFQRL